MSIRIQVAQRCEVVVDLTVSGDDQGVVVEYEAFNVGLDLWADFLEVICRPEVFGPFSAS